MQSKIQSVCSIFGIICSVLGVVFQLCCQANIESSNLQIIQSTCQSLNKFKSNNNYQIYHKFGAPMRNRKQSSISPKHLNSHFYNRSKVRYPTESNQSNLLHQRKSDIHIQNDISHCEYTGFVNEQRQISDNQMIQFQKALLCYNSLANTNKYTSLFINSNDYMQSKRIFEQNKAKADPDSKRIAQRANKYLTTVWKIQSTFNIQIPQLASSRKKINQEIQHLAKSNCLEFSIRLNQSAKDENGPTGKQIKESIINKLRQQQFADQVLGHSTKNPKFLEKRYQNQKDKKSRQNNEKQALYGTWDSVKMIKSKKQGQHRQKEENKQLGPKKKNGDKISDQKQKNFNQSGSPIIKIKYADKDSYSRGSSNQTKKRRDTQRVEQSNGGPFQSEFRQTVISEPKQSQQHKKILIGQQKQKHLVGSQDKSSKKSKKNFNDRLNANQVNESRNIRTSKYKGDKQLVRKEGTMNSSNDVSDQKDSRMQDRDSMMQGRNHLKSQFKGNLIWITLSKTEEFMRLIDSFE